MGDICAGVRSYTVKNFDGGKMRSDIRVLDLRSRFVVQREYVRRKKRNYAQCNTVNVTF